MAQPPTYNRATNFANYQAQNPTLPLPGSTLDEELSRVKFVIDAIRANLALIQRDDTALANDSVGYDQLKSEILVGINPPTPWATATNYVARDTVAYLAKFYLCEESHVSGVFATDLAAGKWTLLVDFEIAMTSAVNVGYDNTASGLAAAQVQAAIDEIADTYQVVGQQTRTVQTFTANGTWTKPAGCVAIVIEAVGGGGGSGGVDGQGGGTAGSTGGGGSGFYGKTGYLDVAAVASAAVTIGAAGAAGASGDNAGGNGGDTAITIGATTYTFGGGAGSPGHNGGTSPNGLGFGGAAATGVNVVGFSSRGNPSSYLAAAGAGRATGGQGASSPFGTGGDPAHVITATTGVGVAATGYGAGGGGSAANDTANNAAGAAGTAGFMRIWEFY